MRPAHLWQPVLLTLVLASLPALAGAAEPKRIHVGLALGTANGLANAPDGDDLFAEEAVALRVLYRWTVSPRIDLALEARGQWMKVHAAALGEGDGIRRTDEVTLVGPGVRWKFGRDTEAIRPYAQGTIFLVRESIQDAQPEAHPTGSGPGLGGALGVEWRFLGGLSLDVEGHALYARPRRDVSATGVLAGLTFHSGADRPPRCGLSGGEQRRILRPSGRSFPKEWPCIVPVFSRSPSSSHFSSSRLPRLVPTPETSTSRSPEDSRIPWPM